MIAQNVKDLFPNDLQQITYIGEFPTDADVCISLIESGGPHGTYFAKDEMNTPYLKVMVRDPSYPDGYATVSAVKDLITSFADARLLGIVLRGDIDYLGRDDKRRNIFQLNYRIFEYRKNINTTSIGTSVYVKGQFVPVFDADTKLNKVTSNEASGLIRIYAIQPDGSQTVFRADTYDITQYYIPLRAENGNIIVPATPGNNASATSKIYVDNGFVAKRINTDDVYYVYGHHKSDEIDLGTSVGINPFYLVSRDANGDVLVPDTPTANNAATSKQYVDNGFVAKVAPSQESDDVIYASEIVGGVRKDEYIITRTRPLAYAIPRYDSDGDLAARLEPTYEGSATSKKYVDGLVDKAWVCCIKTPACAYSVYNFTLPQKLYSDTRCYIPDDASENMVVSNMQLTFAKGEPPTVIVCKVAYFDKSDNTLHKVSYDLEKLDSAEAVENYTGNNCAYFIY